MKNKTNQKAQVVHKGVTIKVVYLSDWLCKRLYRVLQPISKPAPVEHLRALCLGEKMRSMAAIIIPSRTKWKRTYSKNYLLQGA